MAEEKDKKKKINYLPDDDVDKHAEFIARQKTDHYVVKYHHPKWKELIAWVQKGEQFSEWKGDEMVPVKLNRRVKRVVINLMKPLGEAIEGKLNLIYQIAGLPNSSEDEDIKAAKVSTRICAHVDYVNQIEDVNEDLKWDLVHTGNAFKKRVWNDKMEGFIKHEVDGKLQDPVAIKGEIEVSVPSVFNIRVDPLAKKMEDARWLIEFIEVPKEELLNQFDVTKDQLDEAIGEVGESKEKYEGLNKDDKEVDDDDPTYIVAEYWERKTKKYDEGRFIQSIGKLILFKDKNPALGEIPFWHYGFKKSGDSLMATGPFHHVQPVQREFNRMVSMTSEHLEGWRAKMVVPIGAIVKEGSYTDGAFELLEVDNTKGEVKPLQTPELSPQVTTWRDFLMGSVDTVSNVHEVSYSQLPKYASRAPASLFSMMLEQEDLKIAPMMKRINANFIKEATFTLKLAEKKYKQARLIKIMGRGEETSIEYFKGAEINGNYDVELSIGASLHQSKVIQQRLLIELYTNGILDDKSKILKLLEMGDVGNELRGEFVDEKRAEHENQLFNKGEVPIPQLNEAGMPDIFTRTDNGVFVWIHDNHITHMESHTNISKTEEAKEWSEDTWFAMEIHILGHFQMLQGFRQMGGQLGVQSRPGAEPIQQGARPQPSQQVQATGSVGMARPGPKPSGATATPTPGAGATASVVS